MVITGVEKSSFHLLDVCKSVRVVVTGKPIKLKYQQYCSLLTADYQLADCIFLAYSARILHIGFRVLSLGLTLETVIASCRLYCSPTYSER